MTTINYTCVLPEGQVATVVDRAGVHVAIYPVLPTNVPLPVRSPGAMRVPPFSSAELTTVVQRVTVMSVWDLPTSAAFGACPGPAQNMLKRQVEKFRAACGCVHMTPIKIV